MISKSPPLMYDVVLRDNFDTMGMSSKWLNDCTSNLWLKAQLWQMPDVAMIS